MFSPNLAIEYFFGGSVNSGPLGSSADAVLDKNIALSFYPDWYKDVDISWTIPEQLQWENPTFEVYRSPTPDGVFEKVSGDAPISEMFLLLDKSQLRESKFTRDHYKVRVITQFGGIYESTPQTISPRMGDWQRIQKNEINRREMILLTKFTGQRFIVMRKIRHGIHCQRCWDELTKTIVRPDCESCFGTGYERGYLPHFPIWAQADSLTKSSSSSYFGKFEGADLGGWSISFPELEPEDLLVRLSDNVVFSINPINNTSLQSETVRQVFTMSMMTKEDIASKILLRELDRMTWRENV